MRSSTSESRGGLATQPLVSVITATYNAEKTLPQLIVSLQSQTCKDFEWVVADGASDDQTLEILEKVTGICTKVVSEPDFGIYDALNKAIKRASGRYYVVIGADDWFDADAIRTFSQAASDEAYDIITARVYCGDRITGVRSCWSLLPRQFRYVSAHSVGTLFKRELHDKVGYYSARFPIAADELFILEAVRQGAKVRKIDAVVGGFSLNGVSMTDTLGTLTESLRIQLRFSCKYLAFAVFLLKILKNWRRL